nr:UDP-N-acetylmuramoyl-L-alanine--D-glutamate ligase [bacterium]
TCTLIYNIFQEAKSRSQIMPVGNVYLTGNIGKDQPLDFIDDLSAQDWIVYELSSFQLQDLHNSPHIGVCLMVTSDHLDHHANLEEYHEAKAAITAYQTSEHIAIYNGDYPNSVTIGAQGGGRKFVVSKGHMAGHGAHIKDDLITLHNVLPQPVEIDCTIRNLRGVHNLENIAAAALVATLSGVPVATVQDCVKNFNGLEHRLQFVGEVHGTHYYNDSISTVPETTIAAMQSFTEPTILILGGHDKGLSSQALIKFLSSCENLKAVAVMGDTATSLKKSLENNNFTKPIYEHNAGETFEDFLANITSHAESGDVVLLSPGYASFGMFENYKERGNLFAQYVHSLKQTNG